MSAIESLLSVLDDEFRSRPCWHVGHELLLAHQVFVSVGVSVRIRLSIWQIGEQIALVIVVTKSALRLLERVELHRK